MGDLIAMIGAVMVVVITGVGATIGMGWVQRSVAGILSEEPEKYGKTLVLQLIPTSSALYGFVVGFMVLLKVVLGPNAGGLDVTTGVTILLACVPMIIVGFVQTLIQARVCVSCAQMIAKQEELSGRAIVMSIFTELITLLALIVSILTITQL